MSSYVFTLTWSIGQFMVRGMAVDPIKKILIYPDGHDPVPVEIDNVMMHKNF